MSSSFRDALVTVVLTAASADRARGARRPAAASARHPAGGAHQHPQAAKLKNPVDGRRDVDCRGTRSCTKSSAPAATATTGKGDGEMGARAEPEAVEPADADWKHGATDGEIFTVIRDGVKDTGMKAFASKMTTHQIWDVVNYVRSIGPNLTHSRSTPSQTFADT